MPSSFIISPLGVEDSADNNDSFGCYPPLNRLRTSIVSAPRKLVRVGDHVAPVPVPYGFLHCNHWMLGHQPLYRTPNPAVAMMVAETVAFLSDLFFPSEAPGGVTLWYQKCKPIFVTGASSRGGRGVGRCPLIINLKMISFERLSAPKKLQYFPTKRSHVGQIFGRTSLLGPFVLLQ